MPLVKTITKTQNLANARTGNINRKMWMALHGMAINLPKKPHSVRLEQFIQHLYKLKNAMSCKNCKRHFAILLKQIPPKRFAKYGRIGIIVLMYIYHSIVNKSLKHKNIPFMQLENKLLRRHVLARTQLQQEAKQYNIKKVIKKYV
jgi:hypothetical protein